MFYDWIRSAFSSWFKSTPTAETVNEAPRTRNGQKQRQNRKAIIDLRSSVAEVNDEDQLKTDAKNIQSSKLKKASVVLIEQKDQLKIEQQNQIRNTQQTKRKRLNNEDFGTRKQFKANAEKQAQQSQLSENQILNVLQFEKGCHKGRKALRFENVQCNRFGNSKPPAEYTILLLGSTGVGKSTFINGFANYLKFTTLSEALKSKPEYPIPSIFTICNDNYEEIEIAMGEWKGPAPKFGESVTQECCGYDFETPMGKVTLIDTPGTDDTKGLDQDKINCEKIIEYLRNYEHLSAICIMLQANCSRENAAFEFCLKQLFSRLPKSFAASICFVFTHAQMATVPFEIGSTGSAIENFKKKVRDMSGVVIPFGQNCFSVDNEGLRMVAQYQSGQRNFKIEKSVYMESWTRSEEQCAKLVKFVSRLTPQPVKDIIFLNKALKVINVLYEAGSEINAKIQELNSITNVTSNTLNGLSLCQQYLEQKRFAIATEHIVRPLELFRFTCKEENCPIVESLGHLPKLAKESCHSHCKLDCLPENGRCNSCGCNWDKHEHVKYELFEPGDPIEDAPIVMQLSAQLDVLNYLGSDLNTYKENLDEMQASVRTLEATAVAFATVMKETPIVVNQEGISEPMVASLLNRSGCPKNVTMADAETTLGALYSLPIIGVKLKTAFTNLLMVKDATS